MLLKDKVVKQVPKMYKAFKADIDYYNNIDVRLSEYMEDNLSYPDRHNAYEILAVFRFMKLCDKYRFNITRFKKFVRFYECLQFPSENGMMAFKLTPVQVFQFANIMGLYKNDGYRLCNTALLYVPRKFSKTTSVAAIAIWDLLFGPSDAQAYIASNSFNQAQICFKIISNTLKPLDPKMTTFRRNRDIIYSKIPGKTSFIQCLSSSPDKLDGLNASTVVLDEGAAAVSNALKNVLVSSQGVRKEPLTITITTASTNIDGPFATVDLPNYKKILEGIIEDDTVFASIFEPDEGDDYGDPKTWYKVQPHMGITVNKEFYERSWANACRSAEDMTEFRTKLLNVNTLPVDKEWISRKIVEKSLLDLKIEDITTRPMCMVGVDLSIKDDLSATSYGLYDSINKEFVFYTDFYIPKETLYTHANSELYLRWAEQGYIHICGTDVIDYEQIGKDIIEKSKYLNILSIGYDAYRNRDLTNYLKAQGIKCLRPFKQTYANFTSPVEAFEQSIYEGRIHIANNPIISWMIDNVAMDEDSMKNKKPVKKTATKKIDGVVTMLMSLGQFMEWRR